MRSYNPQTNREGKAKSAVQRAMDSLQAEKAADPVAHAERVRAANERAQAFQRKARGERP